MSLIPTNSKAQGFWQYSAQYYHAAEAVRNSSGRELLMPALQLYGLSIELALKAFILKRGTPLAQVKGLSHNLILILALARKRKLGTEIKLSKNDLALISLLNMNYASHRFRYITSGPTRVPQLAHIALVTERLVTSLEQYCTGMVWGIYRSRGISIQQAQRKMPR